MNSNLKNKYILIYFVLLVCLGTRWVYEQNKSRKYAVFIEKNLHPCISGSINGVSSHFILDTGGTFFSKLDKNLVKNLPPSFHLKTVRLFDFKGVIDEFEERYCESIDFLDLKVKNFQFIQTSDDEKGDGLTSLEIPQFFVSDEIKSSDTNFSYLGHKFFFGSNFSLDLKNKKLRLFKSSLIPFFSFPFGFLTGSIKIPVQYNPKLGLVCQISSSYGVKKLLVDTGAPISILKNESIYNPYLKQQNENFLKTLLVENFSIGEKSFDNHTFHIEPFFGIKEVDGILGLDFFKDKKLFINWQDEYMCIQENK